MNSLTSSARQCILVTSTVGVLLAVGGCGAFEPTYREGAGLTTSENQKAEAACSERTTGENPEAGPSASPAAASSSAGTLQIAEVEKVVKAKCVTCHMTAAPVLKTQADILKNASMVKSAVARGSMPLAPTTLNSAEKKLIADWNPDSTAALKFSLLNSACP